MKTQRSWMVVLVSSFLCLLGGCIQVNVEDRDGGPIQGFAARFDERGERTTSVTQVVPSGSRTSYLQRDLLSTTLVFIKTEAFHPGIAVLEPCAQTQNGLSRNVEITLLRKEQCLEIPEECQGATVPGVPGEDYVPGQVLVFVHDWLWQSEIEMLVEPYCLTVETHASQDLFSMWVSVPVEKVDEVLLALEASDIVMRARIEAWPGGPVAGATILVQFNLNATINTARDLVDSLGSVRWLETSLAPKWAVVEVAPGFEGEWICLLEKDPIVRFAAPNGILLWGWPPFVDHVDP